MRRFSHVLLAVLFFCTASFGWTASRDVSEDTEFFLSLGLRSDGGPAERAALDYVAENLDREEILFRRISLNLGNQGNSYGEAVLALIASDGGPGSIGEPLVLAAPVDGGAYSMALLLEYARRAADHEKDFPILLAFLGGEDGESRFHPYGSRILANELRSRGAGASTPLLYLKMEHAPAGVGVEAGGGGLVTPYRLLRSLCGSMEESGRSYRFRGLDVQMARLGLNDELPAIRTFLSEEIAAVGLVGEGRVSERLMQAGTETMLAVLDRFERKKEDAGGRQEAYIVLRPFFGTPPRIIAERPFIVVFLLVCAFILTAVLVRVRDVRLNIKRLARHWWAWPLLAAILFLFIFLSTLIIEETIFLVDFPTLWIYAPNIFMFFKLTAAAALVLNYIMLTRGLPLPRSPHFYSYAAALTAFLSLLMLMAVDVMLSAHALWSLMFFLLLAGVRNIYCKVFFLLMSMVPFASAVFFIVSEPYETVLRLLLFDRVTGSAVLTLLLLPFILGMTSLNYWRIHYHRVRRNVLIPAITLALTLASVTTISWILNLTPFDGETVQPVLMTDRIDLNSGTRLLELESPAPIGSLELTAEDLLLPLEDLGRRASIRVPADRVPLAVDVSSRRFLGRRTVLLDVETESPASTLSVRITSGEPFTLHEASVPFEMKASGRDAELFIGDNPPRPFTLRFTVNADSSLVINWTAKWDEPLSPPEIKNQEFSFEVLRVAVLSQEI